MQAKLLTVPALFLSLGLTARAQQTLAEFSICDNAEITIDSGGENATLPLLCDKNDLTVFEADNQSGISFIIKTGEPWVAKGLLVVPAEETTQAPSQMTLYGRNETDGTWNRIGRFNSVSYPAPFVSYVGKTLASQTGAYTEFKLEINKIGEGTKLRIADMQILGYPGDDADNLAVEGNGTISAPDNTENLWAITGGNYNMAVTLKNVKAEYGVENAWVDFTFDEPTKIDGYGLTANQSSVINTRPATWDLLASNDGENWVTLDMRNNEASFDIDNYQQRYSLPSKGVSIDYAAMADRLYEVMIDKFYTDWRGGKYLVHSWNEDPEKINAGYNYWWQAHVVDACTDAFMRTNKQIWRMRAMQVKKGMYGGGNSLWNTFFDDMEWMAIACIRGYQNYTIEPGVWLDEAKQLFEWIWGGWSDVEGGGIAWNSGSGINSKNACSNAPAIIIAARLYQITGEQHYLDKAIMIHDWMLDHLRFDDGFIKDGPNNERRGWAFTYNQGTWVGGLLELYKITRDEKYRETAVDLMDKCLDGRWYSPKGIMREQGSSDGGLFKGIYVRYITEWILSGGLDAERQYRYAKFLVENAKSLYNASLIKPEFKVMPCWQSREATFNGENNGGANGDYHASILLSGVFLFESVDMMRRAGVLNDDYSVKNENIGKEFTHYRLRITDNRGGNNVQFGAFSLYGEAGGAGVDRVSIRECAPCIEGMNGAVRVSGVVPGSAVSVVTPAGMVAASEIAANNVQTVDVGAGIYIVKISGECETTAKVVVK